MAVPALLRKILSQALDADTFAISDGRPGAAFLSKVRMIIQGGDHSAEVPRKSLLSTTATKAVAVVDRSANVSRAAEALVEARFAFGGRSPYSPDTVFIHEFAMKPFVEAIMRYASKYLANQDDHDRQSKAGRQGPGVPLLDTAFKDPRSRVLVSGSSWAVVEVHDRYERLTCEKYNTDRSIRKSALLQKKVERRVLLLHPVSSIDDAIDLSNSYAPGSVQRG